MGIELGDGGINSDWQVVITLNADKDSEYADYVTDLIENLFGIDASTRIRDKNTLKISCSSISLVEFLISKGAVKGNKIKQKIDILEWIIKNKEYKKAFVRGLVDTDGCLFIHKHNVKGTESENVVIILGRGWNQYNWNEYLEYIKMGIPSDKKERFERNRNLFYVSCSRAKRNLVLLFTQELSGYAMETLNSWFKSENIHSLLI